MRPRTDQSVERAVDETTHNEGNAVRQTSSHERMSAWVVDYSAARAKAIAWLGSRYLLATPVTRREPRAPAGSAAHASSLAYPSPLGQIVEGG